MKQRFYRLNKILGYNPKYCILLGERSNGKSYAVKEFALLQFKKNKEEFVYLRRFELETKASAVEEYFADMPIEQIFNKKYDCVSVYRKKIYLAKHDNDDKIIRGEVIGYCHYLSGATHYKSRMFPNVNTIIYEEFVSKDIYLDAEPDKLLDYCSTVFRRRNGLVFLIGNTISRVCPYFYEWQLKNIPKMEQGAIDIYDMKTNVFDDDGIVETVRIAVEYCENSGKGSSMFFGKVAENINNGAWATEIQPHLEKKINEYEKIYEVIVEHMGFSFVCQLLVDKNGFILTYVYPNSRKRRIKRIITNRYCEDIFTSQKLREDIKPERMIKECLNSNRVAFSDNLTGSEFKQILREKGGV